MVPRLGFHSAVPKFFVSAVNSEFSEHRDQLAADLRSVEFGVEEQDTFSNSSGSLLEQIARRISGCEAAIHLLGNLAGNPAKLDEVKALLEREPEFLSGKPEIKAELVESIGGGGRPTYTQWEAYLALHFDLPLFVFLSDEFVEGTDTSQGRHFERLKKLNIEMVEFFSASKLADEAFRAVCGASITIPPKKSRPDNLPFRSLGSLFTGRVSEIEQLEGFFQETDELSLAVIAQPRRLHELGGTGKTQLAIEYARQHSEGYHAKLFVRADSPTNLYRNLANLAAEDVLNLKSIGTQTQDEQVSNVMDWLGSRRDWLLILDSVDDVASHEAVREFLARLKRGHVLVTTRLNQWPGTENVLKLSPWFDEDGAHYLLQSSAGRRPETAEDSELAEALTDQLRGLPLSLEQAAATIRRHQMPFEDYKEYWEANYPAAMAFTNPRESQYPLSAAITWRTSFDYLTGEGRELLELLAWMESEPIPEWLLDSETALALNDLEANGLVKRHARWESFQVHGMTQEITRSEQIEFGKAKERLEAALRWVSGAFSGDPDDARTWPRLAPLAPHALAIAWRADEMGLSSPDLPLGRLFGEIGILYGTKGRNAEAELLLRRSLAIEEENLGPNHTEVALRLSQLALLLKSTSRMAEAEPLFRRVVGVRAASLGKEHQSTKRGVETFHRFLVDNGRSEEDARRFVDEAMEEGFWA